MEGQARCYCYLGRRDQALEIIEKLRKEATNTCHLTCILNLELVIHHHFGGTEEEIAALQHLICLHPYNPWHWKRLAEGYLTLLQSTASASSYSKLSHGDGLRGRGGCEGPNGTARDSKLPNGTGDSSEGKGDLCLGQSCSTSVQKHCIDEGAQAQNCDNVWLKACMCFIRARLTLRMLRFQQSSFVLQRSKKALLEVDDALQHLEIQEGTLQLITEVMGKDLVAEKMREDNQDGESLVGLCISDFDDRWYNRVRHALLRSEDTPAE
ncbi:hypothetical protein JZ751_023733 [Albula glossodonta]|uniref:Uncharacterized protein n=1 Tax=Albula glossodonta TaxID=121402 RepID=A0A8T2NK21_9TELE|nr:hypothetical protein JZ751_023733 [Albula glossodonta]